MISLLYKTFKEWQKDRAWLYAASITFYALFAIAPLLILVIAVAGYIFGERAVQGEIVSYIQNFVGRDVASAIQVILENAKVSRSSILFTILGIILFLFGASRVFMQLKYSLNRIWDVKHQPARKLRKIVKSRFISILLVLAFGLLLILSLVLSAALATASVYFANIIPLKLYVFQILNIGISFLIITFVFAMIYKFIPDLKISWNDVWIGAAVTSLLFMIGNMLIGLYMRNVTIGSVYGAAGSIIIVLLWLYYCAQIFFLGAEFTHVYAKEYGSYSSKILRWFSLLNPFKKY